MSTDAQFDSYVVRTIHYYRIESRSLSDHHNTIIIIMMV